MLEQQQKQQRGLPDLEFLRKSGLDETTALIQSRVTWNVNNQQSISSFLKGVSKWREFCRKLVVQYEPNKIFVAI